MRKIVVLSFISLDGVMQAPGGPEEDKTDNFKYGGWQAPYVDQHTGQEMMKQISQPFDLLLGRKTYEIFASYWPQHEDGYVGKPFKECKKYIVSHNEVELPWIGSEPITGDVVMRLQELKASDGPMLQVHGSGNLIQTLLKYDLVDELWLKTFPLTLGSGKKLFSDGTMPAAFELVESSISSNGVIFANYKRSGEVQTGSM